MTRPEAKAKPQSKRNAQTQAPRKRSVQARAAHRLNKGAPAAVSTSEAREPSAAKSHARIAAIDAWRGIAIVAMIAYHFAFDLRYFGVTHSDFEHDGFWLTARSLILGSFMLIAGVSLALSTHRPNATSRFIRHVAIIGTAALIVTAASALLFPQSFIWFGVLHAIAASLLLARPLTGRPALAAMLGVIVIVLGLTYSDARFDTRALGWIGFMTSKPTTEDYVPLFPWSGLLFLGVAVAPWVSRNASRSLAFVARAPRALRWMGQHSLAIYLIHQPVLMGLLWVAREVGAMR
jgi:uncharacterized membrane protein